MTTKLRVCRVPRVRGNWFCPNKKGEKLKVRLTHAQHEMGLKKGLFLPRHISFIFLLSILLRLSTMVSMRPLLLRTRLPYSAFRV
jgi:hypothetical protein